MSYCNQCGVKKGANANFCQNCGSTIVATSLDANIKVATTNVTTEKAFATIRNGLLSILLLFKKLVKPVLVLAFLGAIIFSLTYAGFMIKETKLKKDKEKTIQEFIQQVKQKIQSAQTNVNNEKWKLHTEVDPASGKKIARFATVRSNDGLCSLGVEKRINGDKLTYIYCDEFSIYDADIDIRFDVDKDLHIMRINRIDSNEVYIPSRQGKVTLREVKRTPITFESVEDNSHYFNYDEFIKGLLSANIVAIKITPQIIHQSHEYDTYENPFSSRYFAGHTPPTILSPFWVKFPLKNSKVISHLGKEL